MAVALLQRLAVLNRDQHVLQPVPPLLVVVDVTRPYGRHAEASRERDECAVPRAVAVDEVVL